MPLVNPDGRNFCLAPGGDPWWRKNRSNHSGLTCRGVDLNRNYDFLWSSGIGTSADSCTEVFKGPNAFSEPETRNVRWMIDSFTNLACMIDVHSYSELVLYPWGDDENQTTDPNQNFQNPAFNGQRGVVGSGYREYIAPADLSAHVAMAERIRDGIAAVRGRTYIAEQSISLYPTSATTHDYVYARSIIDTGRRRILGFTLETAREFQPPDAEKQNVITEVSVGLMECLFETLCPAEVVQNLVDAIFPLQAMRRFRDLAMVRMAAGARYEKIFRKHSVELVRLAVSSAAAREAGAAILGVAGRFMTEKGSASTRKISKADLSEVAYALAVLRKKAGKQLKADIDGALADMTGLQGKTLTGAFKALAAPRTRSSARARPKRPHKAPTRRR